jgi:hypothetical protein
MKRSEEGLEENQVHCTTSEELALFEALVRDHPKFPEFAQAIDDTLEKLGHDCHFCLVVMEPEEDDADFTEETLQAIIAELEASKED